MAPTAATAPARVIENQESTPAFKSNHDEQIKTPFPLHDVVNVPTPELDEDMSKAEVMNGRIKMVFGLAMLAALSSLAGQLRIFGLSEVLGVLGAVAILSVAVVLAIPQLRRNFRASP